MWRNPRRIRKILLSAAVAAFAATPATAELVPECWQEQQYGGLFCNSGEPMTICQYLDECYVSCGEGFVLVTCQE